MQSYVQRSLGATFISTWRVFPTSNALRGVNSISRFGSLSACHDGLKRLHSVSFETLSRCRQAPSRGLSTNQGVRCEHYRTPFQTLILRQSATPLHKRAPYQYRAFYSQRSIFSIPGSNAKLSTSSYSRVSKGIQKRCFTSNSTTAQDGGKPNSGARTRPNPSEAKDSFDAKANTNPASSSDTNKYVINRLPSIGHIHRPNKEELLAAATGFWSRLKVRFKWFSIRSVRPFNIDDIGAFFSWVLVGHVIWIILGTTTFFSLVIFMVNTVFAQETLARWIGNYLTKSSGIKVIFESAIVPKWGDGVITFKNVFVSRRPGQGDGKVSKGSPTMAAAAAAAIERARDPGEALQRSRGIDTNGEETNYTQFDLSLDTVDVTLSFTKWFNGKGLLRDVEIKGVRGVVDRTFLLHSGEGEDPRSYKHKHQPGDFEIDSFKMEDLLVTVYQPDGFPPFPVSIFSCDLPRLRRQWLFYDFLSANTVSGSFDNSLFTIHPRQTRAIVDFEPGDSSESWKKHSRLRIDNLNIAHLNRGVEGPFSWIHEGKVDIVADVMLPTDVDESIVKVMSDFYDRMEATVTSNRSPADYPKGSTLNHGDDGYEPIYTHDNEISSSDNDNRVVIMDLRVHLNDVRAAVPLFTRELSYVNNALIRPIVAYINSRRTFIPIHCRVIKRASEFDGSWTIFDSGLMDDLSAETYRAFAKDVMDDQARLRRLKKVGLWSLQVAVQALFMGMAGNLA